MRKVMLILFIVLIVALLTGCSPMDEVPSQEKEQEQELSMLMILKNYYSGLILVDRETNVMYWMSNSTYNSGNLTLLVDQDGNPKVWDGQ